MNKNATKKFVLDVVQCVCCELDVRQMTYNAQHQIKS